MKQQARQAFKNARKSGVCNLLGSHFLNTIRLNKSNEGSNVNMLNKTQACSQ